MDAGVHRRRHAPWVVKFCGTLYDNRWVSPVEEVFRWHAENEPLLRERRNLARVAIVWSPQTSAAIGNAKTEASQLGLYHALVEARIPFEMVYEQLLGAENLDRFKLLILPNVAALSDKQCAQLRDFVQRGGSLVATFETSLYDETGKKRSDFALADLFGVAYNGKTELLVKNSYINLERGTKHEILRGFEQAGRTINTIGYADVSPTLYFGAAPLTRVPSYPDLPMEDVYPRQPKTDIPEIYLREVGASRLAYFPGDIDRSFWEVLDPDHGRIIANTVRWALNEPDFVTVNGPGVLDIAVWEQDASRTVHIVNLTNPMLMKGPMRELYPVGPLEVSLRLPKDRRPKETQLLVSKAEAKARQSEGAWKVTLSSIADHEVIAVQF